jgi:hypothetical protein
VCVSLLVLAWPELSRRSAGVGPLPRQQRRLVATRRWAARGEGKPAQCGSLLHDSDLGIVAKYGCEYAGLIQYDLPAQDVFRLGRLRCARWAWRSTTSAISPISTSLADARRPSSLGERLGEMEPGKPTTASQAGLPSMACR